MKLPAQRSEYRGHLLNRSCHLVANNKDNRGDEAIKLAIAELKRIESKFSTRSAGSLVYQLNEHAGSNDYIALDPESRSLLDYIQALWGKSLHMFDPTSIILQRAYGDSTPIKGYKAMLGELLPHVAWSKLEVTEQGARLTEAGALLDLDSCIRPYAVDSARKKLRESGVDSALINLDTDVATIGRQPDGANWLIGVRYPKGTGAAITRIKLNNQGYSIRGNFEQHLMIDGERFSRSLSPVDGQPIPGLLSIGVVADRALDAWVTVSMARLKTEQPALKWLADIGLPWIAIDRELQCHGSLAGS